jgi:hypothetical protein
VFPKRGQVFEDAAVPVTVPVFAEKPEMRRAVEVPASGEKRDIRASLALLIQLAAREARWWASSQMQA